MIPSATQFKAVCEAQNAIVVTLSDRAETAAIELVPLRFVLRIRIGDLRPCSFTGSRFSRQRRAALCQSNAKRTADLAQLWAHHEPQ